MHNGMARLANYSAFFLTGVGTALLGAILPAVLHRQQMSDGAGGSLLLAGWAASTSGAVLARGHLGRAAALGLLLVSLALLGLSLQLRTGLYGLYIAYGVGLGLTMTAISLRASHGVSTAEAALELNRLNLLWAAGACVAPVLAVHSLRFLSIGRLCRFLSLIFSVTSVFLLVATWRLPGRMAESSRPKPGGVGWQSAPPLPLVPLRFCLFAAASVGLESALGSWLTTFATRAGVGSAVHTALATTFAFWAGLLLSRAAHAVPYLPFLRSPGGRWLHLAGVTLGVALLFTPRFPGTLPLAGLLCGLGLGPLYPYVLSATLPHFRSTAIFVLAGLGASVVPWLTGSLSSLLGSLTLGMLVPAATLVLLLLSAWSIESPRSAAVPGEA